MGILTCVKRFVFYGGITATLTLPTAYKLGFNKGMIESTLKQVCSSSLEKITANQYKVINPNDHKEYLIDFNNKLVILYSNQKRKQLEDIFSK
jgi:hypothetical protein